MVQKLKRDLGEVEGRAQRDAGDDAGQRDGQDDQQRDRLAPEEARPRHAAAQSVPSTSAITVEIAATRTDSHSAAQTSGRFQATPNHCVVRPGGGHIALVLGGEGIDEDQQDRQVQEQQPPRGGELQRRASAAGQSASKAPSRFAPHR
jgi:hypothetical protein